KRAAPGVPGGKKKGVMGEPVCKAPGEGCAAVFSNLGLEKKALPAVNTGIRNVPILSEKHNAQMRATQ
ncbi:hypothetical protein, partial [Treponema pallidum]|uniref:hypothetical protein n=1 Tax=Treponema pallidum TaxID=160 RepID=UPI001C3757F4